MADESISPGKGKSLEECDQELEARYQLQLDELALDFVRQQAEIEHECKEVGHKPQSTGSNPLPPPAAAWATYPESLFNSRLPPQAQALGPGPGILARLVRPFGESDSGMMPDILQAEEEYEWLCHTKMIEYKVRLLPCS